MVSLFSAMRMRGELSDEALKAAVAIARTRGTKAAPQFREAYLEAARLLESLRYSGADSESLRLGLE